MQEKMASRNPLVRAAASAASQVWFPFFQLLARGLPPRMMRQIVRATGRSYMRFRPKFRAALRANLAQILGASEDAPEVARRAAEMIDAHFDAWVDFLHFATRPPEQAAALVEGVVGFGRLVEG
ncbi:MAG TPA: hypothetical protein VEG84_02280, partial [Thermoanaerobaculia bacterium]|nr:hypothetical protein [Thermoanaerobaculia bacterium]